MKDRRVPLPDAPVPALKACVEDIARLPATNKTDGFGKSSLPGSLVQRAPSAPFDLCRWSLFLVSHRWRDPNTGWIERHQATHR